MKFYICRGEGNMIKRKRLDRDIWTSITCKRYIQKTIESDDYKGIIALLYIDDVSSASIWQYHDGPISVCDKGMKWLEFLPFKGNYVLTAMINSENKINLWYIDIICNYGFDEDGTAYFDDLFLDLILRPDGELKIDDEDELEEAYHEMVISSEMYIMAYMVKDKLISELIDVDKLTKFCLKYLHDLEVI